MDLSIPDDNVASQHWIYAFGAGISEASGYHIAWVAISADAPRYLQPGAAPQMNERPRQGFRFPAGAWLRSWADDPGRGRGDPDHPRKRGRVVGRDRGASPVFWYHRQRQGTRTRPDYCWREAAASPAPEANPDMPYQIIDAVMARAIQADAVRAHSLFAWIVMRDLPEYPASLVARLVTEAPTPYILLGHTLAEVQAQLPPGLERSGRRPSDPPEVVEVWFPAQM
jgi:hypothetical protein